MSDRPTPDESAQPVQPVQQRRWIWPTVLTALIVAPIVILIFSNLEATEVSWAGLRFKQPLWLILVATFLSGMVGGKLAGWGWRRWRRRRRRLKEELEILRKHGAEEGNDEA